MAYGVIKVDSITFTNGGSDQTITVSGIVSSTSGNLTVTGTVSGSTIQGGTLVSGATVTGGAGEFTTLTGGTAGFTTVTGTTITGTTANFVSGVFTTQISGVTVTGTTAQFTNITGGGIGATTITGTTVTGTTANFVSGVFTTQISGATVTGTTANFTSGNFTSISGGTQTVTSGVFALGTAANPSISFASDPNTGIYSPGADQVAISTNGTGRLFVNSSGQVGIGVSPSFPLDVKTAGGRLIVADSGTGIKAVGVTGAGAEAYTGIQGNPVVFLTDGAERMRLDSSGRLGLGTSSPGAALDVVGSTFIRGAAGGRKLEIGMNVAAFRIAADTISTGLELSSDFTGGYIDMAVGGTSRMYISSLGRVGIGTTSPGTRLEVTDTNCIIKSKGTAGYGSFFSEGATGNAAFYFLGVNGTETARLTSDASNYLAFGTGSSGTERARIDSSGRLLVGTSTGFANTTVQIQGGPGGTTDAPQLALSRGLAPASISSGQFLASLDFTANNGGRFAAIAAYADATPGNNDYPGRLEFSVTADGSASPTEALRISSNRAITVSDGGNVVLGTTAGTKIGTATTQKIGFYNATPVVQPAAVADATTAVDVITQLNDLLAKLRTLGIIAT